jgi:hypothetical protein
MPGFEFLRCGTTADAEASHEHEDPCGEGDCCTVESAKYHSPRQQEIAPLVWLAVLPANPLDVLEHSLPPEVSLGVLTAAPPELQSSWQFSLRMALPVRAPSFAS